MKMFAKMRPLVKEALNQTLIFGKFLCLLHITDKYICSPVIVCFLVLFLSFFMFLEINRVCYNLYDIKFLCD